MLDKIMLMLVESESAAYYGRQDLLKMLWTHNVHITYVLININLLVFTLSCLGFWNELTKL